MLHFILQAWQHGAKILIIAGEDDKQVNHKWHSLFKENCPDEHKDAIQIYSYPGAGHLIEPPYMPHVRVVEPGKKRMQTLDFMHKKYFGETVAAFCFNFVYGPTFRDLPLTVSPSVFEHGYNRYFNCKNDI